MSAPLALPRSGASTRLTLAALVLCAAIPVFGAGEHAEAVLEGEPAEVVERLMEQGYVVLEETGSDSESYIVAWVLFERPVQQVVALLRQAARQTEYRTELDHVETIRTFENGRIDEQRIRIMFTTFVYRLRYHDVADTEGKLEWALDPDFDNDMRVVAGFWEFHPFEHEPNRTLARFGSNVNVGPAVPRFIQKRISRKTVLRYLKNSRRWIDSGGEWRP